MKKILIMLSMSSFITVFSNNTIGCFGKNKNTGISDRTVSDSLIQSAVNATWYSKIGNANNITLVNGKQLVISHIENSSPISDKNLDFSLDKRINDVCATAEPYWAYLNGNLYGKDGCDSDLDHYALGDEVDGNYFNISRDKSNLLDNTYYQQNLIKMFMQLIHQIIQLTMLQILIILFKLVI